MNGKSHLLVIAPGWWCESRFFIERIEEKATPLSGSLPAGVERVTEGHLAKASVGSQKDWLLRISLAATQMTQSRILMPFFFLCVLCVSARIQSESKSI